MSGLIVLTKNTRLFTRMEGNRSQLIRSEYFLRRGSEVILGVSIPLFYDHRTQQAQEVLSESERGYYMLVEELSSVEQIK